VSLKEEQVRGVMHLSIFRLSPIRRTIVSRDWRQRSDISSDLALLVSVSLNIKNCTHL